ncbi:hypothetical protein EBAPG3_008710 [Nitrosospira lacus]|uniref:Uncharacterized protein n=1 Tax=Nitrosospira lacus TaxID=1288494 RepID=A0A1W6SPW7_9PROT|nr:hypothetical protein [Nitrosospira lacus]ARO87839.1 hypothetical protein EBAPG3_008710 [Nitrosospira lacus]
MRPWSDFYDLIMPGLPGCPFAMADNALRRSAIVFCEQSLAWRFNHPDIPVMAGTSEYAFLPPAGAAVHCITNAVLDGEEIETRAGESGMTVGNWRNQSGTPLYVLGGAASATLVPIPDAAGMLTMVVALKPSAGSVEIDDMLFNEFRESIVHGALAQLMLSPKKPYTNAQLATHHERQFSISVAAAGMRVARSYTRAPLRTTIMARK